MQMWVLGSSREYISYCGLQWERRKSNYLKTSNFSSVFSCNRTVICLLRLHSYRVSRFLRLSAIVPTSPRDIHDDWLKNNSTVLWYHESAIGVFSKVPFDGYLLPVDLGGGVLKFWKFFTNKNCGCFKLHLKLCDEILHHLALYRIGQEPLFCLMFTWSPTQDVQISLVLFNAGTNMWGGGADHAGMLKKKSHTGESFSP